MRVVLGWLSLVACVACGGAPSVPPSAASSAAPMARMQGGDSAARFALASNEPAPAAPQPAPGGRPAPAKSVADAPHSAAMLIYTAQLSLAVFQVERGLEAVERFGREAGGYLSTRQDNAVTIRVPRDRFDDVIGRIEALGDVLHRDIRAQDVTDEYVDLEARLRNARAMRARLEDLLTKASVKEAIEIEGQLGRVTEEIERFEGKLKLLRDQMAFSTITATFAPVAEQPVRDTALLPFPWVQSLGLSTLLSVHP
jgi:hypothetical protein